MDNRIEALLLDYKGVSGQEKELSLAERERFAGVNLDTVTNRMYSRLPGESHQIERINPDDGTIIYLDSRSRHTISLEALGYQALGRGERLKFSLQRR